MLRQALQAQDFAPIPDADEVVILNVAVALVRDNPPFASSATC